MISGISGFLFFAIEHIRKPGNHGKKNYMLIFRGIKTIYLIWSTFLTILCDQDLTLKVLVKVIKKNLHLKLEGSFFVITARLYLDTKKIAL